MVEIAPDLKQIKQYYEENIKKGYTIEQITTNLKNNAYPDYVLHEVINLLEPQYAKMSLENPKRFDYGQLPEEIKQHIEPKSLSQQSTTRGKQAEAGADSMHPTQATTLPGQVSQEQKDATPKIEAHPGLEGKSLYMFLGIVGAVVIVIIVVVLLLAGGSNDTTFRDGSTSGIDSDDAVGSGSTDGFDLDAEIDNRSDDSDFGSDEGINETTDGNTNETSSSDDDNQTLTTETDNGLGDDADTGISSNPATIPNQRRDMSDVDCSQDSDCNDYYAMTIDTCVAGSCENRLTVDPDEFCQSNDNFCRPECYGYLYNDTDCVDDSGRMLCETDSHCDDKDPTTEGVCQNLGNYCIFITVSDPADANNPPEIISEYNATGFELVEYTYQVLVNDSDNDTITLNLKGEPDDMEIDEDGLISWTPPATDNTYTEYSFSLEAYDGEDETEQEIVLKIFMSEASDSVKQDCGESKTCYSDTVVALQDHKRCEFLGVYWSDTDYSERDNCIFSIVYANKNTDLCEYIHVESTKSACLSIR